MLNIPDSDPLPYGVRPPQFRLPDAAHVGGVHLQVSDLRRSVEYYQQVIGLRAQPGADDSVALTAGENGTPLVSLSTRPGTTSVRRGAFGLYHFAILLPARAALGRFAAHLAQLGVRAGTADHLVSEAFYLRDPDGLGIEVYADRPRETWQHQRRELAMTTDTLDVDSVIAAARGEAWAGAPAGTSMGHVHLHVGRLDEAEAFYHRAVGLDKIVWSYPGALFMSAGGYHHHLGTNVWAPGPAPSRDEAQLLEWELRVPSAGDVARVAGSIQEHGYLCECVGDSAAAADPWGTRVRILAEA